MRTIPNKVAGTVKTMERTKLSSPKQKRSKRKVHHREPAPSKERGSGGSREAGEGFQSGLGGVKAMSRQVKAVFLAPAQCKCMPLHARHISSAG